MRELITFSLGKLKHYLIIVASKREKIGHSQLPEPRDNAIRQQYGTEYLDICGIMPSG